jgi:hypothetical protein
MARSIKEEKLLGVNHGGRQCPTFNVPWTQ